MPAHEFIDFGDGRCDTCGLAMLADDHMIYKLILIHEQVDATCINEDCPLCEDTYQEKE